MPPQAEIFRLHGQLLAAVEERDAANKAFATSLALWPQLAEGWLSWGTFCDKQVGTSHSSLPPLRLQVGCLLLHNSQHRSTVQHGGQGVQTHACTALQAKGGAQDEGGQAWLENTVTCYLQAIRHGSTEGRGMMARILNLLSFHDTNSVVSQAIRKHGRQVAALPTSPIGCFLTPSFSTLLWLPKQG